MENLVRGYLGLSSDCAEGVRFELTVPCGTPHFKCGALDHSATPPCRVLYHKIYSTVTSFLIH